MFNVLILQKYSYKVIVGANFVSYYIIVVEYILKKPRNHRKAQAKQVGYRTIVEKPAPTCASEIYRFIALPPSAPNTAEATAMTTFRILSQRDFLTAITFHTSFQAF